MHLIIDNLMTVRSLQCLLNGKQRGGTPFWRLWTEIGRLLPGLRLRVDWVPSHGKKPKWRPADPTGNHLVLRALNDWADTVATSGKEAHKAWRLDEEAEIDRAKHRAHVALLAQYNALEWLAKTYPPDKDWGKKLASKKRGGDLGQAVGRQMYLLEQEIRRGPERWSWWLRVLGP